MTAVNLMGAMTEDSGRGRRETLFINISHLSSRKTRGVGLGVVVRKLRLHSLFLLASSSVPVSLYDCHLSTCFFICSYFLLPVHIILFFFFLSFLSCNLITFLSFPMIEYLTMQQFSHFISSLPFLSRFIVAEQCEAGAQRKAEEGHN